MARVALHLARMARVLERAAFLLLWFLAFYSAMVSFMGSSWCWFVGWVCNVGFMLNVYMPQPFIFAEFENRGTVLHKIQNRK